MKWFRHGFLNTFEHALTRVMDALTTLMIVRYLDTELFSRLVVAQAFVAPLLFFFLSPETILYREYSPWKESGELRSRLWALRLFGWLKGALALFVSFALALWSSDWSLLWIYLWAFSLALGPQLCGADREFLRMELKLSQLNALNLYQKGTLFFGTLWAVSSNAPLFGVALAGVFSVASSAAIAGWLNHESSWKRDEEITVWKTALYSVQSFSLWNHFAGVINNWILTMDLFFLGLLGGSQAYALGLYGAVLKIANLAHAAPSALGNLFSIWIGRSEGSEELQEKNLRKFSFSMVAVASVQAVLIYVLAPYIFSALSAGKWSPEDQHQMVGWLGTLLLGGVLHQSSFLLSSWVWLKGRPQHFFWWTYVPMGLMAVAVFYLVAQEGSFQWTTWGKVSIFGAQLLGFMMYLLWQRRAAS